MVILLVLQAIIGILAYKANKNARKEQEKFREEYEERREDMGA